MFKIYLAMIIVASMLIIVGCGNETPSNVIIEDKTLISDGAEDNTTDIAKDELELPEVPSVPDDITAQSDDKVDSATVKDSDTSITNTVITDTTSVVSTCTDSDGGQNYTVKGTLTILENGVSKTYTDYCRTGSFKGYVYEYHCDGSKLAYSYQKCLRGCSDGRCYE
jgi:hypothetical protein